MCHSVVRISRWSCGVVLFAGIAAALVLSYRSPNAPQTAAQTPTLFVAQSMDRTQLEVSWYSEEASESDAPLLYVGTQPDALTPYMGTASDVVTEDGRLLRHCLVLIPYLDKCYCAVAKGSEIFLLQRTSYSTIE